MKYLIYVAGKPYSACSTISKVYSICQRFDDDGQLPLTVHIFRKRLNDALDRNGFYALALGERLIKIETVEIL